MSKYYKVPKYLASAVKHSTRFTGSFEDAIKEHSSPDAEMIFFKIDRKNSIIDWCEDALCEECGDSWCKLRDESAEYIPRLTLHKIGRFYA